jgi:hypothetical protein
MVAQELGKRVINRLVCTPVFESITLNNPNVATKFDHEIVDKHKYTVSLCISRSWSQQLRLKAAAS